MSVLILVAGSGVCVSIHKCISSVCKTESGSDTDACCVNALQEKCGEGFSKSKCCLVEHLFSRLPVENSGNINVHVCFPKIINSIFYFVGNISNLTDDSVTLGESGFKVDPLLLFQRLQI